MRRSSFERKESLVFSSCCLTAYRRVLGTCVKQSNLIWGTMLNRVITVNLRKKTNFYSNNCDDNTVIICLNTAVES